MSATITPALRLEFYLETIKLQHKAHQYYAMNYAVITRKGISDDMEEIQSQIPNFVAWVQSVRISPEYKFVCNRVQDNFQGMYDFIISILEKTSFGLYVSPEVIVDYSRQNGDFIVYGIPQVVGAINNIP